MENSRNSDQHQEQQNIPEANHVVDEDIRISVDEEGGILVGGIYIPGEAYCSTERSTESKGPRLIIRYIENTNFKSYANTVRVGPFHHRFSAVIGPNGSGKSNVIDSMLFVFGYRAEQSNNLSEFIHNSSKYPNVNSCKVAVHFQQIVDKEDGTFDLIPNTEIVIARTAFKNNSSFYSVGQREVEFKDVAKILEEHNIDLLHNRFLILQGEVESIASMKPMFENKGDNGLSEYLEDIIGTERYKKPLFLIDERLAKLDKERLEKQTQCSLAELELKQNDENSKLLITMLEAENLYLQLCNYNQKNSTVICEGYKSKRQRLEKEKINGEDVAKKIEQLKTLMKELKDRLSKMPQWEDKIKTLALHEIPNEEMPPFKSLTGDELEKKSIEDVANEFMQMEEMLKVCKPETLTIEEINEKRAVSVECIKVFEDIAVKRDETCKAWLKLDYKRSVEFMEELRIINLKLKEIYQKITFGGHAELDWIDVDAESERIDGDDLTGFIGFLVRRTNDKWKRIKDLSGDEKTLSSLALVFAIRNYKPSPLYIMDDALDFKNSFIVANCINEQRKDTQIIMSVTPKNSSFMIQYAPNITTISNDEEGCKTPDTLGKLIN